MEPEEEYYTVERRRARSHDDVHSCSTNSPGQVWYANDSSDFHSQAPKCNSNVADFAVTEKSELYSPRPEEDEHDYLLLTEKSEAKTGLLYYRESEICFICMGDFNKRNPAVKVPCEKACNNAPVHAKCIYEWGERQKNGPTCPLCRSKLGEIEYSPPDLLRSHRLVMFGCRKAFITLPVPKTVGIVRCFIIAQKVKRKGHLQKMVWKLFLQSPPKLRYPSGPKTRF